MKKDVVAGLGEIGLPILKLLSKQNNVVGYDIDKKLMNNVKFTKFQDTQTSFLHIAIPVTQKFITNVITLFKKFSPECIVIHSTISPGTTEYLQKKMSIPIIYSATRGVHKNMLRDLKRYTKFFVISSNAPKKQWATSTYSKKMKSCGVKTQKMSKPETLELAKIICDTSYLGWLINYSQISNMIAKTYNVNYDEMWLFSDEIHKFLGNRPKMYPGYIGGHCVIPNLDLLHNQTLELIKKINTKYSKKIKNSKNIYKKYQK
jgi:UDP-N-acetyl-D-mannosaminuronate dehydrogenase|tara:strand:+ start:10292 stop:11074 length:783 start_codon:yes stop_codon:yes gene_type:complete